MPFKTVPKQSRSTAAHHKVFYGETPIPYPDVGSGCAVL